MHLVAIDNVQNDCLYEEKENVLSDETKNFFAYFYLTFFFLLLFKCSFFFFCLVRLLYAQPI